MESKERSFEFSFYFKDKRFHFAYGNSQSQARTFKVTNEEPIMLSIESAVTIYSIEIPV